MNKADLLQLIEKHLAGNLTVAENAMLIDYYEAFESEPDVLAMMSKDAHRALKDEMRQAIWKRIDDAATPGPQQA